MQLKVSGKPAEGKLLYSEPKLVEHGDITKITLFLFGPGPADGFRGRGHHKGWKS